MPIDTTWKPHIHGKPTAQGGLHARVYASLKRRKESHTDAAGVRDAPARFGKVDGVPEVDRDLAVSVRDQSTPTLSVPTPSLGSVLRTTIRHRGVQAAVALWVAGYAVILWLGQGSLPFARPAIARLPFALQIAAPTIGLIEIFVLMVLAFLLTRKRVIPDMAASAPDRRVAWRETVLVLAYAVLGQVGGWIVGPALGYGPFSFHIADAVFGHTVMPEPTAVWIWVLYNFLVFAAAPYLYFRRHYTDAELNLRSTSRRKDALLIFIVLAIEAAFQLSAFDESILSLSPYEMLLGAPLRLLVIFIGTVMPTTVLIYAILLPRYLKLTGSAISAVLLGGLTYAAGNIVGGWSAVDSPQDTVLSLIFVLLTYFGPGMIQSVLTLRTGNAWAQALGYHVIAPHMIPDAPFAAEIFGIA